MSLLIRLRMRIQSVRLGTRYFARCTHTVMIRMYVWLGWCVSFAWQRCADTEQKCHKCNGIYWTMSTLSGKIGPFHLARWWRYELGIQRIATQKHANSPHGKTRQPDEWRWRLLDKGWWQTAHGLKYQVKWKFKGEDQQWVRGRFSNKIIWWVNWEATIWSDA